MKEIIYLIQQADHFVKENEFELSASYNIDAWITLKEYLIEKNIQSTDEIYFKNKKDNQMLKDWLKTFYLDARSTYQFKANIEIILGMINYFNLKDSEKITLQRNLADSYFNLKEFEISQKLYENYIKNNPQTLEYYYGYALTLLQQKKQIKAINILEEGIDNAFKDDYFLDFCLELLIEVYTALNEIENADKIREKQKNFRHMA